MNQDISDLRARSEAVVAAEAAQDIKGAVAFYADDAIIQSAGLPQVQGKEALSDLYRQFFAGRQVKEFSGTATNLEVSQSGDLAYESGINRMVFADPNGDLLDMGKYLAVWKKINNEWLIVALSFTSDAPSPTLLEK